MPGFDKTGPKGEGAMTGRKQGRCVGNDPEDTSRGGGLGRGLGRGKGRNAGQGNKGFGRKQRGNQ